MTADSVSNIEVCLASHVALIRRLPFGRSLALRLVHRVLMQFASHRRAKTYFGAELDCDVKDLVGGTIIHFGTWEPNASRIFAGLVQPGDVALDLGANIGYFSVLLSRLVGPDGKVIAVEALPKVADALSRNIALNSATNVTVKNVAVAAERGTTLVYEGPPVNVGASTIRADRGFEPTATVATLPIDDLIGPADAIRTTLIKIDVEGVEVPVVERILESLDRYSPRLSIAVEANALQNPQWLLLFQRFLGAGFSAYDLANHYVWSNMIDGIDVLPSQIDRLPDKEQVDILFTRTSLHPQLTKINNAAQ